MAALGSGAYGASYDGLLRLSDSYTPSGGSATTYLGALEEVTSSGSGTTTIAYYGSLAESFNGTLSYTLSDGLGSVNTSGQVTATQLYSPYGAVRYSSGILPTDYGFTHQRADAVSGLDDYGARYYDPVEGSSPPPIRPWRGG